MRLTQWIAATLTLCGSLLVPLSAARAQSPTCLAADADVLSGAYRQANGALASILPGEEPGQWRITHFDSGRSHRLHPVQAGGFRSAADLNGERPVAFHYRFSPSALGPSEALTIESAAGLDAAGSRALTAQRLPLRERPLRFRSGEVELVGRLTLPAQGQGPFKAVVFVHGSDPVPSVGREWLPHLLAAHGVATLVFDKRGTGCSQGQYVQHVGVLSDDVVAAVAGLRRQPEIDGRRIGLAGFSQGGWVAPLAALKDSGIRFVAVAYGLAMSMADEDRLEAPLKLREQGLDEASVAEFEALNAALHQLARDGFQDWAPFERLLEKSQARPWFAQAARQASWLGALMQMGVAQAKVAAPGMFTHFFQPFYEPVPTLEKLDIPMLWLIAGRDIEAPPAPTLAALERLQRQGKPISVQVFPNADHGLQDFEVRDGQRVRTKYAEGYFAALLRWVQAQP